MSGSASDYGWLRAAGREEKGESTAGQRNARGREVKLEKRVERERGKVHGRRGSGLHITS